MSDDHGENTLNLTCGQIPSNICKTIRLLTGEHTGEYKAIRLFTGEYTGEYTPIRFLRSEYTVHTME